MSAYKIGCPHCSQHLECDESYAGMKINCPSCQKEMVIPALPAASAPSSSSAAPPPPPPPPSATVPPAPAAAPAGGSRLVVRPAQPAHSAPAPSAAPPPSSVPLPRPLTPPAPAAAEPSKSRLVMKVAIGVVIAAPLLYFAFQWAANTQSKFNEAKAKDDDKGVLGGQVSHILELNQVLDETDPTKFARSATTDDEPAMGGRSGRKGRPRSAAVGQDDAMEAGELPMIMPTWTLDVNAVQIPEGKVCGTISKQTFASDDTQLISGSATPVLKFSWPAFRDADLDLLVYLRMKAGQGLENSTWTVAANQKGDIPQVVKRWKIGGPTGTQKQQAYTAGYVVKLEFGKRTEGGLPGKIYVALPDEEKSVVSGKFTAFIRVVNTAQGGRNRQDAGGGMMDE